MNHGVIFDLDGVLVASGPAHTGSWRLLAKKLGRDVPEQELRETFGRPSRDIIRILWGEQVTPEEIRRYDDMKEAIYRDLITGMVPLTIGVREMLAGLAQAGLVLSVATSGPPENLDLVLRETNLSHYFRATVHGFDVQNGKPAPDCFLLAAERCGLPPERCVVVEDAPVGIAAATAAGLKSIALVGTHPRQRLQTTGASLVVDRPKDITADAVMALLR